MYILNLFRINPRGEVVNYGLYGSPSFEVTKPAIIIIISSSSSIVFKVLFEIDDVISQNTI